MASDVDRIHREFTDLIGFLAEKAADDTFRKVLIMSAASYCEHILTNVVMEFVSEIASSDALVTSLVHGQVVSRKYHTWFAWNGNNANQFFKMFGEGFRSHMVAVVKASPEIDKAIKAFLELGDGRNMLAHENFAAFAMQKTADEIFRLYQDAMPFIECVRTELRACSAKLRTLASAEIVPPEGGPERA
jgi:hypothetical protein